MAVVGVTPEALPASLDAERDGSESSARLEAGQLEALVSAMQPQTLSDSQYMPPTVRASILPPHHPIARVGAQNPHWRCARSISTGLGSGLRATDRCGCGLFDQAVLECNSSPVRASRGCGQRTLRKRWLAVQRDPVGGRRPTRRASHWS